MADSPLSSDPPLPPGSAFDPHHPPPAARLDDCVHCGFCLPTCPTYALWGEEMDSPRGRIELMRLAREGEVALGSSVVGHLDACLGCMACVTACPSGVRYDELIEATRAQIERNHRRSIADRAFRRLLFALMPHPARLRVAAVGAWAYQRLRLGAGLRRLGLVDRLPARLRALEGLMPQVSLRQAVTGSGQAVPRVTGTPRRRVALLSGCVQRVFFGDVNAATARVLAAEGCEVVAPAKQGCCGALELHAGEEGQSLGRARELIDALDGDGIDTVVVNAAGCGSTMKDYGRLLADDPAYAGRARAFSAKVRDVTELLAELEPVATRHPVEARVAYHDACHLAHAQGVRAQPRQILTAIPGLELAEVADAELCCGSAGIYNLVQPDPAEELGRRKAASIAATRPEAVATANPGCTLQIRRYLDDGVPVLHPIELIDASIRGVTPAGLSTRQPAARR